MLEVEEIKGGGRWNCFLYLLYAHNIMPIVSNAPLQKVSYPQYGLSITGNHIKYIEKYENKDYGILNTTFFTLFYLLIPLLHF